MVRQDGRSNMLQVLIVAVVALPHPRMKQTLLQKKATCSCFSTFTVLTCSLKSLTLLLAQN